MWNLAWGYRPVLPSTRAQSVQIVHAAHASAARGARVWLPAEAGPGARAEQVWADFGLSCPPGLRLLLLRGGRSAASAQYRAALWAWSRRHPGGTLIVRKKRHALWARRWLGPGLRLVLEQHELDSALAAERGEPVGPWLALEAEALGCADALICNAPGTLAAWRASHAVRVPAVVLHNGTRVVRGPVTGAGVGVVGSLRREKDAGLLGRAAAALGVPVTVVGEPPESELARRAVALGQGWLRVEGPVPWREVPAQLRRFRVLLVPLSPGLFGEQLTSPLKLWDALASGVPVVAAGTPAVVAAAGAGFVPYEAGELGSLVGALRVALWDAELRARVVAAAPVRSWAQRALELEGFLGAALGAPR